MLVDQRLEKRAQLARFGQLVGAEIARQEDRQPHIGPEDARRLSPTRLDLSRILTIILSYASGFWRSASRSVNGCSSAERNSDDDDLEDLLLARSPRFQQLVARSRESITRGKGLARDDFWRAVGERTAEPSRSL